MSEGHDKSGVGGSPRSLSRLRRSDVKALASALLALYKGEPLEPQEEAFILATLEILSNTGGE